MHKLIEYACEELEDIERKVGKGQKLSMQELQYADTLAHMKKNLMKADEMSGEDEYSMRGYSRRMSYDGGGSYAGSEDYVRPDGSYRDGGMSYARGRGAGAKRDSMGRYSRAEDETIMQLEQLMDTAQDEHTRKEIRKILDRM